MIKRGLSLGGEQSGPHHLLRPPLHRRRHRHRAERAAGDGRDRPRAGRSGVGAGDVSRRCCSTCGCARSATCRPCRRSPRRWSGRGSPGRPGPSAGALLGHRAAAARDDRRARTSRRSRAGRREIAEHGQGASRMTAAALAREAERQRQQGRDASQLARRGGAERRRSRAGLLAAGAPGITVHPRADARHITFADVRDIAAELAPGAGREVEFNIEGRSPARSARAGASRSGPISARWCRCGRARSPARPAGIRRDAARRAAATVVVQASGSAAFASACSSIPDAAAVRWAAVAGRRSHRAVHRAVRARLSRGPAAGERASTATRSGDAGARARPGRQRRPRSRPRQSPALPRCCRTSTRCRSATR